MCEEWGLPSSSVLFVGDSAEDMSWGFTAGCRTCLLNIGAPHTAQTLGSGYTHFAIDSLDTLIQIIGQGVNGDGGAHPEVPPESL